MEQTVCVVAIARDELSFVDEWVCYHRLIGVDHIYLYDDEEGSPLCTHFHNSDFVTVIPWFYERNQGLSMRNQVQAYWDSLKFAIAFDWVAFLDIDEFLVFREVDNVKIFLRGFPEAGSVSLNWHVFGHNGHFDDPDGLVTNELTRRMLLPSPNVKSITRTHLIAEITPHHCKLTGQIRVDANNHLYYNGHYHGRTERAHVNHYQCRSFQRWMKRAERGDVNYNVDNAPEHQQWRLTRQSCLEKFVTTVALDKNEFVDTYMCRFKDFIYREAEKLHHNRGQHLPKL